MSDHGEEDDFFKNQKRIYEEELDELLNEMEEENPSMKDYHDFMKQSSSEYMMYSTMDLMKSMNIFRELRELFANLSDWDRITLYYAYELMQRNMQMCYKLGLYLFKMKSEEFVGQIIYWGLLLFCMANVQTAYSYLIYRVYRIDRDFARRLHEHMKEQFVFFENPEDMNGTFNDATLPNRVSRYGS